MDVEAVLPGPARIIYFCSFLSLGKMMALFFLRNLNSIYSKLEVAMRRMHTNTEILESFHIAGSADGSTTKDDIYPATLQPL
jgi:hypothetical protein